MLCFWHIVLLKGTWTKRHLKDIECEKKGANLPTTRIPNSSVLVTKTACDPLAPRLLVFEYFTYEIAIFKLFSFQVCIYPAERKGCRMKDLACQKVICSDTAVLPSRDPEAGSPYRVSSPRGSTSSLTPLESVSRPYSPLSVSGALAAR